MLIPEGYALCRWRLRCDGDIEEMNVTCGVEAPQVLNTMEEITDKLLKDYDEFMVPGHQTEYSFVGVNVSFGVDGEDPVTLEQSVSKPGTNGANPMPQNCSILVKKQTSSGGPRNRGRFFLPGFAGEGSVLANGDLSATLLENRQLLLDGFFDALSDARDGVTATPPVILHTVPPNDPTPVTSFRVASRIATQRRRLRP